MRKNLKKALFTLLAVVTMTVIFCFGVSGSCGENVTYTYNSTTKELVISGSGNMENYTYVDFSPFQGSDIKSVVINKGVTTIGNRAFQECYSLSSVTIPDSVTTIGDYAFYDCESLKSITIPNSVTTIGYGAFYGTAYYNDKNNWENGLLYINDHLVGAEYVENIKIKSNTKSIAHGGLNCERITVDNNSLNYSNDSFGVLFNKNKTKLVQYPKNNERAEYNIPDSVTTIEAYAFSYCSSLHSIKIPDSVTTIGDNAFCSCYNLTNVIIPDSVTTIGYNAFGWCDNLESVIIGSGVKNIGSEAFANCYKLKEVIIPDTVKFIGDYAFGINVGHFFGCDPEYNKYDENFTIKGVKGSAAEKYAKANDITFIEYIPPHAHSYTANVTTPATLTADGKAEYKCSCGDIQKTETIAKVSSITLSATKYIYDGKNKTPKLTVKDANGKTLVKNTDYKITVASKRAGIGRYTVKVTFMGNYSGTKNLFFYILPGKPATVKSASQDTTSNKLTWSAVPGATGYTLYYYSNSKKAYKKINTTTNTSYTVKGLLTGTKYTFKIVAYGTTAAGKVYDSETYALLKSATKTKTPELTSTRASSSKGKAYVYHTDVKGETGYTVYYSTSSTTGFKKYANFKADTTRCDITKLTSGKTYYFKVRTYIKTDSGYVYSAWSNIKGVKVK